MTRQQRNAAKIAAAMKGKNLTRQPIAADEPLLHEETFPKVCSGCGEKVTNAGGCVTRCEGNGKPPERFHLGCW